MTFIHLPLLFKNLLVTTAMTALFIVGIWEESFAQLSPESGHEGIVAAQELTDEEAVQRPAFFLRPESLQPHFVWRTNSAGQPQRVFGIGVNVPLLHPRYFKTYDQRHRRIFDEALFDTLRPRFDQIYATFTYERDDVIRPAHYDSLRGYQAMIMGASHLPWWLRTRYAAENEPLSYEEQLNLHNRIDRDRLEERILDVIRFGGRRNVIVNLFDEPERGTASNLWHFTGDTARLMYELASPHALVSLGLGPVGNGHGQGTSNALMWHRTEGSPEAAAGITSNEPLRGLTGESWKETLNVMMDEYQGAYDVLFLNSYAFQIADPRRAGAVTRAMLEHPTINRQKPVWIWFSAEHFRHSGNPEREMPNIRQQVFSAIANEASGVLFYPDVRVDGRSGSYDERLWHLVLGFAEELQRWKPVLEQGRPVTNFVSEDLEWILYRYRGAGYLFAVNHSSRDIRLSAPVRTVIPAGVSGVFVTE
ncbi:hypothetical protein CYPRO_2932 [Cyclonatronum proteinivorum]|uniref:Uncharacterized protein n=1 Tax=Cyclonatronum proteinivorum TaxID=1457365 RepID=A0A345UNW7_9BACT|nr:hypothetical protein [Cyclonatronum proteinivorum]AXJ02169.1 hypothetical protein CYPRO_2932 [Cyclonatronum proteinivorum]